MTKQNKTKLQFILGGVLAVTFAVAGCNNGDADKTVVKDSPNTEMKPVMAPKKDSMDSLTGHKAPVVETPPK